MNAVQAMKAQESPGTLATTDDRQLDNILSSGEIAAIFLGGTLPNNKVATLADIQITSDISRIDRQLSIRTDHLSVDIDQIKEPGYYDVQTNLPEQASNGRLLVQLDDHGSVIQTLNTDKGQFHRKFSSYWGAWEPTDFYGIVKVASDNAIKAYNALNYNTSHKNDNIDDIKETGYYEVQVNLPFGITLGELRVGYDTEDHTRIIQELKDTAEAVVYRRQFHGGNWSQWQTTTQTDFNDMVVSELNQRATLDYVNRSIVNTYVGTEDPNTIVPSIGKTGDKYHRFATSAPSTLKSGTSLEDYSAYFELFYDNNPGVSSIGIDSGRRTVYIGFIDNADHTDQMILNIKGTDIPLQVVTSQPVSYEGTYDASFDSTIQGIKVGDAFELKGTKLTGKDEDYTKFNDTWYYTPVIDQTYDWATAGINQTGNPVLIQTNTFSPVVQLTTPARAQGVYQLTFTATWKYTSVTSSAIFRWSLDNGQTWKEIWTEPKDTTNDNIFSYSFPKEFQGPFEFKMEAKCETTGQTLTIDYAHIVIERKK